VRLSAAGEHYLSRSGGALAAIAAASDDLRQGVSNSLYVHSSPSFAALWLAPRLRAFAQTHPDISFNLRASPTHSDFALGQADIDIRYGIPQVAESRRRAALRGAHRSSRESVVHTRATD